MASIDPVKVQFDDLAQQHQANTLGMWIFLSTEVLFFGGLFLVYAVYRWSYSEVFISASPELSLMLGAINTAVLLSSSLTIAAAHLMIEAGRWRLMQYALMATLLLGFVFLGVKFYEYYLEFQHQLVPFVGEVFSWDKAQPERARLFFNLYFAMTGLHAIHLFIGCGLVTAMLLASLRSISVERVKSQIKLSALYWHFVDVVWVFIFPLLYLAR